MTTIYFPDTNFFLEFRKANELPWTHLLVDCPDTIELLVPAAVVTELDNHKRKGAPHVDMCPSDTRTVIPTLGSSKGKRANVVGIVGLPADWPTVDVGSPGDDDARYG